MIFPGMKNLLLPGIDHFDFRTDRLDIISVQNKVKYISLSQGTTRYHFLRKSHPWELHFNSLFISFNLLKFHLRNGDIK